MSSKKTNSFVSHPIVVPSYPLSFEQQHAIQLFERGCNLFITGPGGAGKTSLIHHIINKGLVRNKKIQVCAMTGCAAILMRCKARTLHSWSGMRLGSGTKKDVIQTILNNRYAQSAWKQVNVLILDEVSMLTMKHLEALEEVARLIRRDARPFGGIQIIFTGDFYQLPPPGSDSDGFCFESPVWQKLFPLDQHVLLTQSFRQSDNTFVDLLNNIRHGKITEEQCEILKSRINRPTPDFVPTKLYPIRATVERINEQMFQTIDEPIFTFDAVIKTDNTIYLDTGKRFTDEVQFACQNATFAAIQAEGVRLSSGIGVPQIQLKRGALVMCTFNIQMEQGICNGTQGIITGFVQELGSSIVPLVRFENGVEIKVNPVSIQSEDLPCVSCSQIPLTLSWATTIHKSQGMTLNAAIIDLGNSVFADGQAYVALSRVRSLDGLYLLDFNPERIKVNPRVVAFYENLETRALVAKENEAKDLESNECIKEMDTKQEMDAKKEMDKKQEMDTKKEMDTNATLDFSEYNCEEEECEKKMSSQKSFPYLTRSTVNPSSSMSIRLLDAEPETEDSSKESTKKEDSEIEIKNAPPTALAIKNHHPRDDKIHFQEEGHIYTVNGEVGTYKSATTYIHEHFTPFNSKQVLSRIVRSSKMKDPTYKYYGMDEESIQKMWSQTSVDGTALHYDIECYMNGDPRENNSIEYSYFLEFVRDYPDLVPYRTEWCVWHEDVKISGSIDMVFINPDGTLQIYDWKRTGDLNKNAKTPTSINPCIGHVPDSKFWHYAIQLNLYRRILQEKYGKIVTDLYLVRVHPDNDPKTYERVEVPFMDEEIEALFQYRKRQLETHGTHEEHDYHPVKANEKRLREKEEEESRNMLQNYFQFLPPNKGLP